MPRSFAIRVLLIAALLPSAAFAQSAPDGAASRWTSHRGKDKAGTHSCSVFPLGEGAYPMFFFFGRESDVQLSLEGGDGLPLDVKLKVDGNPELDGSFPAMSMKDTRTLIRQIRAGGQTLTVSKAAITDTGKLGREAFDIPLAGAVEQLDQCKAWLKP